MYLSSLLLDWWSQSPLRNSPTASVVTFTFLDISLLTLEASYFLLILVQTSFHGFGQGAVHAGQQPFCWAVILLYRANLACVFRKQGRTWGASRIFAHDDYDQKENILPSWLDTSISWRHRCQPGTGCGVSLVTQTRPANSPLPDGVFETFLFPQSSWKQTVPSKKWLF